MGEFYPFFIVIFAGVFFSTVFRRFHVPWVISLIVGGIAIGPHGINLFEPNETLEFIAQIGLVFLMFMAGLEVNLSTFRESKKTISKIAFLNGALPFGVGLGIGYFLGYDFIASALLGIIFTSSSIAVIIPSLQANKIITTRLGKSIVAATIVEDVASLILLSFLLQSIDPITHVPLIIFYPLLLASLAFLRWLLPKLKFVFSPHGGKEGDVFQQELRVVFFILVGTVIVFEAVGLHPIIAGFFAGLVLSGSISSRTLREQLRTISYGIFIPTFFVMLGMKTDISVFVQGFGVIALTLTVVFGSVLSKFLSGWCGGKLSGFNSRESSLIGVASMPQLSTTLAVVFTGVELGLLRPDLVSSMIVLSIFTVFVSPIAIRVISRNLQQRLEF